MCDFGCSQVYCSCVNTLQTWETLSHDEDISVQSLNLFLLSSLMCQSLHLFGFTVSYSEKYELMTPIKGPCENTESGPGWCTAEVAAMDTAANALLTLGKVVRDGTGSLGYPCQIRLGTVGNDGFLL